MECGAREAVPGVLSYRNAPVIGHMVDWVAPLGLLGVGGLAASWVGVALGGWTASLYLWSALMRAPLMLDFHRNVSQLLRPPASLSLAEWLCVLCSTDCAFG